MKKKPKINLRGFKPPKTSKSEILLHLILFGSVSIKNFSTLSGFRTRISDLILDHGLILEREWVHAFNKFGNRIKYANHIMPESQRNKAVEIYKLINH